MTSGGPNISAAQFRVSCFEVTIRPKGFLEVGKLIITATVKNPENMFFLTWAMQPD